MEEEDQFYSFEVAEEYAGVRLDKFLTIKCIDVSRGRLKTLVQEEQVLVDDEVISTPSFRVKTGQTIEVTVPPAEVYEIIAEDIPLDIVYEDEDLLVINKSPEMVVHPAAGNWDGTLVHALLHHCRDSLSGINGVMRPGIVHRLDKQTSGLIIVAKNDHAHNHLSAQLADRSLSRTYLALVVGQLQPLIGKVEYALGRNPKDRIRIAVRTVGGKYALTHYKVLEYFGEALSLVECKLETGRTHQIRVHMQAVGHPLVGDPLYGEQPTRTRSLLKKSNYEDDTIEKIMTFPRQTLHAKEISFIHPRTEEEMSFSAPLADDMQEIIEMLKA